MISAQYSKAFTKAVKKYASIRKEIERKVLQVREMPAIGEPLKGNWRGYYSVPVKKNFIIIYLYCAACRAKNDRPAIDCSDCAKTPDDTVRFIEVGPHDSAYAGLPEKF